jgi:hypothetical protein
MAIDAKSPLSYLHNGIPKDQIFSLFTFILMEMMIVSVIILCTMTSDAQFIPIHRINGFATVYIMAIIALNIIIIHFTLKERSIHIILIQNLSIVIIIRFGRVLRIHIIQQMPETSFKISINTPPGMAPGTFIHILFICNP